MIYFEGEKIYINNCFSLYQLMKKFKLNEIKNYNFFRIDKEIITKPLI